MNIYLRIARQIERYGQLELRWAEQQAAGGPLRWAGQAMDPFKPAPR
jgi:hypothetical protein